MPMNHPFVASLPPCDGGRVAQDPYIRSRANNRPHVANSPSDIRKRRDNSLRADPGMSGPVGIAARRSVLSGESRGKTVPRKPTGAGLGGNLLTRHSLGVLLGHAYWWGGGARWACVIELIHARSVHGVKALGGKREAGGTFY